MTDWLKENLRNELESLEKTTMEVATQASVLEPWDVVAQACSDLQCALARKAEAISDLLTLHEFVNNQKAEYHRLLNRRYSPIFLLPEELLIQIFMACLLPPGRQDSAMETIFPQVCHYWRDLALHTPMLWTDIRLDPSPQGNETGVTEGLQRSILMLFTYLQRSRSCLADVSISIHNIYRMGPIFDVLVQNSERCRSLVIIAEEEAENISELHSSLAGTPFPNLQQLTLHVVSDEEFTHGGPKGILFNTIEPCILYGGAPKLQSLQLTGLAGALQPPLRQLTTFHVDGTNMEPLDYTQYRALLLAIPNIRHLSVMKFRVVQHLGASNPWVDILPSDTIPIRLRYLKSLRLYGSDQDDYEVRYHLWTLPIHQLVSLVLCSAQTRDTMFEFPLVRDLSLRGGLPFPDMMKVAAEWELPSLRSLSMGEKFLEVLQTAVQGLGRRARESQEGVSIPASGQLERLAIFGLKIGDDVQGFLNVVNNPDSFRDRNSSLILSLDPLTRQTLDLNNDLDGLSTELLVRRTEDSLPWPEDIGSCEEDIDFFAWEIRPFA